MPKRRKPVKKSRTEQESGQGKKSLSRDKIIAYAIGVLVIGSMTIGLLISALSSL